MIFLDYVSRLVQRLHEVMTSKDFSSLPALPAAPSTMTDALDKGDAATAMERHAEKTRFLVM